MFNLSFKKKLKKILLPINKIIESFFSEIDRSKSQSNKQTPIKKKINIIGINVKFCILKY